ncbi:MAG: hypothetical protein ACOYJD_09335 [Christensenellales bacterium]
MIGKHLAGSASGGSSGGGCLLAIIVVVFLGLIAIGIFYHVIFLLIAVVLIFLTVGITHTVWNNVCACKNKAVNAYFRIAAKTLVGYLTYAGFTSLIFTNDDISYLLGIDAHTNYNILIFFGPFILFFILNRIYYGIDEQRKINKQPATAQISTDNTTETQIAVNPMMLICPKCGKFINITLHMAPTDYCQICGTAFVETKTPVSTWKRFSSQQRANWEDDILENYVFSSPKYDRTMYISYSSRARGSMYRLWYLDSE